MQTRVELENRYYEKQQYGRRMIKTSKVVNILMQHFKSNPVWDYEKKILIAAEVGMTLT